MNFFVENFLSIESFSGCYIFLFIVRHTPSSPTSKVKTIRITDFLLLPNTMASAVTKS